MSASMHDTASVTTHRAAALLFDMDGTLLDAFASANRAWSTWGRANGVEDPDNILSGANHGLQRPELIKRLLPEASDADALEHARTLQQMEERDTNGTYPLDGSGPLLRSLPPHRWAIVTSADAAVARARLRAAGLPEPDVLVSADDTTRSKPDPDGFLIAARRLGVDPAEAVVVEDAPAGLEAARRAGMRAIAISHTADDASHLANDAAVGTVRSPAGISVDVTDDELLVRIID